VYGLKLKEARKQPSRWGMGTVVLAVGIVVVSLLLLSNSLALILSQPVVFEGGRRDYFSMVGGRLELPYIPSGPEGMEMIAPGEVGAFEPFDIVFRSESHKMPYIPYDARFSNSSWDILIPLYGRHPLTGGGYELYTTVPPLRIPGTWNVELVPAMNRTFSPIHSGEWFLEVRDTEQEYPVPILGAGLTPASPGRLSFDITGVEGPMDGEFVVKNDQDEVRGIDHDEQYGWSIELEGFLEGGIELLHICRSTEVTGFDGHDYLIDVPLDEGLVPRDLSMVMSPIFQGEDELFDQRGPSGETAINNGELTLYHGVWYQIYFNLSDQNRGQEALEVLDPDTRPAVPRLHIEFGGNRYPLHALSRENHTTIIRITTEGIEDDDRRIELKVSNPLRDMTLISSTVKFKEDHAVKLRFDPDPFDPSYRDVDRVELIITAEWEYFNRKDFNGEPNVSFNGTPIEPVDETDGFFRSEITYVIPASDLFSGGNLEVDAENSLRFASWISFLFPFPPFIFTIPVPLEGMLSVVWFFLMTSAIIISVLLLFARSFGYTGRKANKEKGQGVLDRLSFSLGPNSDVSIMARTFLGAIFFFFAIYLMFDIFEQPTPGLSILSEETPIWIRMMLLAEASVFEEISGRVVLIGLPLAFIKLLSGKHRGAWRYILGGSGEIGRAELLLILFSGSMFGLAHLGWGPWKVVPTLVHGLMFGYLFVKVGLHASICVHFLFDYSGFLSELTGVDPLAWTLVVLSAFLLGGLYMGEFVNVTFSAVSKKFFFMKPRGWCLLAAHSVISVLLGILLLSSGGSITFSVLFLMVPLIDIAGYKLWKRVPAPLGRAVILIFSYLSFAASPFGLAWVFDPGKGPSS